MIPDVEALVAQTNSQNEARRMRWASRMAAGVVDFSDPSFFTAYHPHEEIVAWLKNMQQSHSNLATMIKIGDTLEGREIVGLKITAAKGGETKPMIFLNSLQHAREWVSGATTTYFIHQLLTGYGQDTEVTELLDKLEFVIMPIINVDGYNYTWVKGGSRMWRKNRRMLQNSWGCNGIDINRNFDYKYKPGGSFDMCAEDYAGPSGFSEPESTAMGMFMKENDNMVAYIDYHAYSQLVMWPWGYTPTPPPRNDILSAAGQKMTQAIIGTHNTKYVSGQIYQTIYPVAGDSVDYAFGAANATISIVVELRDTGRYGFILPPDQIIPTATENWNGLKALARYIIDNNIKRENA